MVCLFCNVLRMCFFFCWVIYFGFGVGVFQMKSNRNIKYGSGNEYEMEERIKGCESEIDFRMELIGKVEGQGIELIMIF